MAPYVYTPLPQTKPDNHFIRVLDLLPSPSQTDVLKARLRTVRLEDKPEYECLSYCWGNTSEKHEPRVLPNEEHSAEPRNLSIGKSLYHALLALRHPTEQKTVWADAACINQTDDVERSNKVAYMGPIYWNKARTNLTRTDIDNFDTESWNAVAELYANPWFRRFWAQQEIGLSRKPFFYRGTAGPIRLLDVFGFDIWMDHNNDAGDRIKDLFIKDATAVKNTRNLCLDYGQATHPGWLQGEDLKSHIRNTPFLLLLKNGLHCQATDPRDHVYGFLGHPSSMKQHAYGDLGSEDYMLNYREDTNHHPIVVADYTKPVDEVFLEVAWKLLHQHQDLRPLGIVCHIEDSLRSNLPSWVPRWNDAGEHFCPIGVTPTLFGTKIEYLHQSQLRVAHHELSVVGAIVAAVWESTAWTESLIRESASKFAYRGGHCAFGYRAQRLVCYTECGLQCLAPDITRTGDKLAIFADGFTPFVVLHVQGSAYKLVGAVYGVWLVRWEAR
ncbi:heterokaryon incompatibility protein-domain-containing protein [Colletotrichum phormii]|uniref:Heterokaryon incompatibility protein-domain-containing protein n=1 Tax=Colletotrichum phormii TaxID=359342 RepID=A0AAI9ZRZ2_9PEZI|nr:heterokaryon incompatibility protein-domain-containing protein [Colletotrichum phormii]KAK1635744.1 heterokaryon incompatibility protein-domain-containing protein [Colletotrichum phormii]